MKIPNKDKALFISTNRKYFSRDVVSALKAIGIKAGDDIFVHSDLSTFGKLADKWNKDDYANCFIDSLLMVVGKTGTVLVPTYTYSYCEGEIFDPIESKSKVGTMTEVFRNRADAHRSDHPIFSIAAIGRRSALYTKDIGVDGFGRNSVFDRLLKRKKTKYVILGVPYFSCNLVHLVERVKGVPYRYLKQFNGVSRLNGREVQTNCEYYVRYMDKNVIPSFDKIEQHLIDKGLMKKEKVGSAWISATPIVKIYKEGLRMLEKDPIIFLDCVPSL